MIDIQGHGGLPHPALDARFYDGVPIRRLAAFAIDLAATTALGAVAVVAFGLATIGIGFAAAPLVFAATGFLYRAFALGRWSATPGMVAVGIEIRRYDGERLTRADAVAHTGLFFLATLFVVPQIASAALMATGPLGRGLHDMPLGTACIKSPA